MELRALEIKHETQLNTMHDIKSVSARNNGQFGKAQWVLIDAIFISTPVHHHKLIFKWKQNNHESIVNFDW